MSWASLHPHNQQLAQEVLTPKQLRIFQDRLNGHTWTRIANAYQIDEATARGHYRRAKARLHKAHTQGAQAA